MSQYLGLLGAEKLNDIVEYLSSDNCVGQKYKDIFNHDKLVPEYVTFDEDDYNFTYYFYFEHTPTILARFDKEGYYNWSRIKYRRLKLEKIMNKKCYFQQQRKLVQNLLDWI